MVYLVFNARLVLLTLEIKKEINMQTLIEKIFYQLLHELVEIFMKKR